MRKSGALLHITSLPSLGGVGTLGKAAYAWIDFLKVSGVSIWQVLPIGPTGFGESPYQSTSIFAGNPLMIDVSLLADEGILPHGVYCPLDDCDQIDFEAVKTQKAQILQLAYVHSLQSLSDEVRRFHAENPWVSDYALYCAIKEYFHQISWQHWPDRDIRLRKQSAIAHYKEQLQDRISYYIFEQYLFFRQWNALHDYARKNGIEIMGDLPIYVAEDSADVWLHPELFELDEDCKPIRIAGVPPDYFSADGQRWGNPLYRWSVHEKTGFAWWIERFRAMHKLFDIIRIDHFIGFADYYAIPVDAPTARIGQYETAPGHKLFCSVHDALPNLQIIAEDLGASGKSSKELLTFCGYPGMTVLQFAVDDDQTSLEHCFQKEHTVVYTGTHDNDTTLGWWKNASETIKARARQTLHMPEKDSDILPRLLEAVFASAADIVIIPMQDLLALGSEARMNVPGTIGENWRWRMLAQDLTPIAHRLRTLNRRYHRGPYVLQVDDILARAEEIAMQRHHASLENANCIQLHEAIAQSIMLRIAPQWMEDHENRLHRRHALYLSAEYLVGRLIFNNLFAQDLLEDVRQALADRGISLSDLEEIEDAALGNGGLGRLAACFLDSAATHNIPLDGYGLRYRYGLFQQKFEEHRQIECADDWTRFGDPWSIRRDELSVIVSMKDFDVRAVPYDMPVIGSAGGSIGTLRLWQCESAREFDFDSFNQQQYSKASQNENEAEDITKLLYPNDSRREGQLLRLRQQYVLCSASLQDMLRSFKSHSSGDMNRFADLHAIQLNDTHPAMVIPELIRLLMIDGLDFEAAFQIAHRCFHYTNHTVMREALDQWDLSLLNAVVPKIAEIIENIQRRLERERSDKGMDARTFPNIIENQCVRMAHLAVYVSAHTNGVAEIHTEILKNTLFKEWNQLYPERFINITNGITQRRWLGLCNPELCALLDRTIGPGYLTDLSMLKKLRTHIDDSMAQEFIAVKREKKRQLAHLIRNREGIDLPENFVFDVQIKRLHEYKRQLLNAFSILDIYYGLKEGTLHDFPPTAFLFGAKAAPGYVRAKAILCWILQIADKINADPDVRDRIRVVFVQNYNCSYAEQIIPAADLSEQISTAGTEASGTGNMKLMLNGACTLGTYDGANIEIVEQAGAENNFIFGATVEELDSIRATYDPRAIYESNPRIRRVVDALNNGTFPDEDGALHELFCSLLDDTRHRPDPYFLLLDFPSYMEAKLRALRATQDEIEFAKKCLHNIASAGKFSSDRAVREYAEKIWQIPLD